VGQLPGRVRIQEFLLLAAACVGCGGGSTLTQPPPPVADFSLTLSSNSVTVQQGSASAAITTTVNPSNGFTGSVQVTLSGLPAGVTSNPASPFAVAAGTSASIVFGATANAATGNFTVSARGTSGSLSHSANLALAVQAGVAANLPRTSYARTDATSAADDPAAEPHHRHIVYDPARRQVFITNRVMNRVEVFSTASQTRIGQILVPGATSADLSADAATVWVGTALNEIVTIDPLSLTVTNRYSVAGLTPIPNVIFDRPVEVLALVNGKAMVRLREPGQPQALLALWDPASNSLQDLTAAAPAVFQQGVGPLARSEDHAKVLAAANDSSGEVALFDATGNVVGGPLALGTGNITGLAANPDGSRFAVVFVAGGNTQVLLLDGSLRQVAGYAAANVHGLVFSRDGKNLYVAETSNSASLITVLDGQSGQPIVRTPDVMIQGVASTIEDADETGLLFALSNRGVGFLDVSVPGTISQPAPALAPAPSAQPAEGPISGGTSVTLSGQNFTSPTQVKFGSQLAPSAKVTGSTQIQASSPPSVQNGPVNLTAYFQNAWVALAPDGFSYGPQILQILPSAGTGAGGDLVQIYGYGFGADPAKITVKIGGAAAVVQKVENLASIAPSLGLDSSYPFPVERITVQTPRGGPGKADVLVSSPAGSTTLAKSFQYLQSANLFSKAALYKFLIYDQGRQRVYLSATDHVDVFDLNAEQWLYPPTQPFAPGGLVPPGGPPPNAGLRGLSLTSNGSQLIVADFGAQNVYLLNPSPATPGGAGSGTIVFVGGVAGFTNSGPARVATTSSQTVFVGLSGEGGSSGACSACLSQMNLAASPPTIQPAPQPEVTSLTGAPLLQSSAAGDQVFLAFASAPGGPLASWNAASPNHFVTSAANASVLDLGMAADGSAFGLQTNGATEVHASDLSISSVPASPELAQIPGRVSVPGMALHPSGALVYQPFLTGAPGAGVRGGVDIIDAHSGVLRMRIFLPQQPLTEVDGLHGSFLAIDENGQRLFAITSSDGTPQNAALSVVELSAVPLGIGTISPPVVSAAGGATITVRGSGFVSGAQVTLNGKAATVTFKDANTLSVVAPALSVGPQVLSISNPDGESVSLDAAVTAQ